MLPITALAADAVPTMNQPDNGFYEGPDPEWATLHSQDSRGTPEHRQYHRDGSLAHLRWHTEHNMKSTTHYEDTHRIAHQKRNLAHRLFHTAPTDTNSSMPVENPTSVIPFQQNNAGLHTYTGTRPTIRSVLRDYEAQKLLYAK